MSKHQDATPPTNAPAQGSTKRNLISLTAASTAQVVIQFLIQVFLAYQFGAKADIDALTSALVVPTFLAAIISGSLSYVLVPDLVACFQDAGKERTGWNMAGIFGVATAILGMLATLAVIFGAQSIVEWLYSHMESQRQTHTARLLGILSWQVVMSAIIGWSQVVHHSRHSFIVPAMGGVWGTLATAILAVLWGEHGIHTVAIAINVGSLVSLLIHLYPLLPHLRIGPVSSVHLRRLLWALMPLVLGSLYLRIDPIVDRSLASQLDEGTVAQLHFAQRLIVALLAISTSGLSVIAFPQLAGHLAASGRDVFARHFALATRRLIFIVMPIAIGFGIYAEPVIADLLQRGRFDSEASVAVGGLIVCFMGMFVGASWGELLARGFYTLGDTRTPTIVGAIALTIGLAAKWFTLSILGVNGIALSTSLSLMLSAAIMSIILAGRTDGRILEGIVQSLVLASLASLVACAVCSLPYTLSLGRTWAAAPLGAVTYAAMIAAILKWKPTLVLDRNELQLSSNS